VNVAERSLRVFVCDDVADMRALVRYALEADPEISVVGEAGDGPAGLEGLVATRPDVLLVDLSMPGLDGLEVVSQMRSISPGTGIVVFSGFEAARMRGPALHAGADRYVEKGAPLAELRAAVREVGVLRDEAA
jgi:DNA-binding NarL/FixJ family response regulator